MGVESVAEYTESFHARNGFPRPHGREGSTSICREVADTHTPVRYQWDRRVTGQEQGDLGQTEFPGSLSQKLEVRGSTQAPRGTRAVCPGTAAGVHAHAQDLGARSQHHVGQTRRATCTTRSSLAACCSGVSGLPASPEAKPHCGLSASRSSGMYCVASRIRASTAPASSSAPCFVVSSPSTAVCCGRT